MDFYRARENDIQLVKNTSCYAHNTVIIAKEESNIVGILEYDIRDMVVAEIINLEIYNNENQNAILKGLIDELLYWNSYIKEIIVSFESNLSSTVLEMNNFIKEDKWIYKNSSAFKIFKIEIENIIPEQLTVDENKVKKVSSWITRPEDVIITCTSFDNMIVPIDGYSRLIAAFTKGFSFVYAYIDTEASNHDFYRTCLSWCRNENIFSIGDLSKRIVSSEEHQKLWIDKCQAYFKEQN